MVLFGEEMSVLAWCATGAVMLGLWLVEPKPSDEELVLKRSFGAGGRGLRDAGTIKPPPAIEREGRGTSLAGEPLP